MVLRILCFCSLCIFLTSCSSNKNVEAIKEPIESKKDNFGELLFLKYCSSCHGSDGKLGLSGATDLTLSTLTDEERIDVITNGRNAMPPMKPVLGTDADVSIVSEYIKEFRK